MTIVFIIFVVLVCIFIGASVWCCLKVGADADSDNYYKGVKRKMTSKCEKCGEVFEWFEDDALVKYGYGDKYIIHCPHCDKLTKVTKIP